MAIQIIERLASGPVQTRLFDVLSTNNGVPARVLNAALADAMRRVEAEYLPLPCARCGAVGTNVASIVAGGACVCAHWLRPGEEIARAKRRV